MELGDVLTTPNSKNLTIYKTFHEASDLDSSVGTTEAVEKVLEN